MKTEYLVPPANCSCNKQEERISQCQTFPCCPPLLPDKKKQELDYGCTYKRNQEYRNMIDAFRYQYHHNGSKYNTRQHTPYQSKQNLNYYTKILRSKQPLNYEKRR